MIKTFCRFVIIFCTIISCGSLQESALANEPPEIPVGLDAYRQWHKWPYQRIGTRAYMRSTYDRHGNNESADASHFLYQLRDDFNVTLDVEGQGILYFARYNHWHGSPWHYEVDGKDNIVKETTTADPTKKLTNSVFIPEKQFPKPLTFTYATTKGADLMWVPLGFNDRFRMAYGRTFYGTGYYIYHLFDRGAKLSQPIQSWSLDSGPGSVPGNDVLEFLNQAGTDIAPKTSDKSNDITAHRNTVTLTANQSQTIAKLTGSQTVRAIKLNVPKEMSADADDLWIRITWDDRKIPSVDAPLPLFFGAGTFYNPSDREYVVKALPVNVRFTNDLVQLACYFPMPFFKSAKIELVNKSTKDFTNIQTEIRTEPFNDLPEHVGYFHATYVDHGENPEMGQDLVFLDTNQVEGGGPWSGNFVGTSFIFSERGRLSTLEGDPRFFFDDSETPQAYGTGTEEWGGGGDYWGGKVMTLPLAGHPVGTAGHSGDGRPLESSNSKGQIESAYRYLLADLMPFGRRALIRFEHGGINELSEHYQSVTTWYGAPFATLELTDTLDIGDSKSENEHQYHSPNASKPYEIESRFEWGPDKILLASNMAFAKPADYIDFEFEANANTKYNIWLRGRSFGGIESDATWLQFDQDIGVVRSFFANGDLGFGNWRDKTPKGEWSWSSQLPGKKPKTVTFKKSGKHRLRIQRRQGGHQIDRLWLSATQTALPTKNFLPTTTEGSNNEVVLTAKDATKTVGEIRVIYVDGQPIIEVGGKGSKQWLEVYPTQKRIGRKTTTSSSFIIQIHPDNWGVLLRRTLDYQFPNQRAKVYIANANEQAPNWQEAGVWYLAGSNTCYYSYPGRSGKDKYRNKSRGELSQSAPKIQTSNRRFRDDEFMLPRNLTRGHKTIRIRLEFTPVDIPLLPYRKVAEQAWSEISYKAYSFVLPNSMVPQTKSETESEEKR